MCLAVTRLSGPLFGAKIARGEDFLRYGALKPQAIFMQFRNALKIIERETHRKLWRLSLERMLAAG